MAAEVICRSVIANGGSTTEYLILPLVHRWFDIYPPKIREQCTTRRITEREGNGKLDPHRNGSDIRGRHSEYHPATPGSREDTKIGIVSFVTADWNCQFPSSLLMYVLWNGYDAECKMYGVETAAKYDHVSCMLMTFDCMNCKRVLLVRID